MVPYQGKLVYIYLLINVESLYEEYPFFRAGIKDFSNWPTIPQVGKTNFF